MDQWVKEKTKVIYKGMKLQDKVVTPADNKAPEKWQKEQAESNKKSTRRS